MYSATVVADTVSPLKKRITTLEVVMPRIILAEFNTHRAFSRNSASSRAIPFGKMVDSVEQRPFIPLKWMKTHKGMQGNEYLEDDMLKTHWLAARDAAVAQAKRLDAMGLTKQLCNRLLEPFMWHKVLVTATEWENFFALRTNEDAEVHMQEVANKMLVAMNASKPRLGNIHIPYNDAINPSELAEALQRDFPNLEYVAGRMFIAAALCAQVSYTVFDAEGKKLDYTKLINLAGRLATSGHWSPFEHCAWAVKDPMLALLPNGNFIGWEQHRKKFYGENRNFYSLNKTYV
jgi:thymidylate synthase ThyX